MLQNIIYSIPFSYSVPTLMRSLLRSQDSINSSNTSWRHAVLVCSGWSMVQLVPLDSVLLRRSHQQTQIQTMSMPTSCKLRTKLPRYIYLHTPVFAGFFSPSSPTGLCVASVNVFLLNWDQLSQNGRYLTEMIDWPLFRIV